MQYQSTRDKNLKASSAQAILNGLAPDGGLYTMPSFDEVKFDYTTVLKYGHDVHVDEDLIQAPARLFRSGDGKTRPRRLYRQV